MLGLAEALHSPPHRYPEAIAYTRAQSEEKAALAGRKASCLRMQLLRGNGHIHAAQHWTLQLKREKRTADHPTDRTLRAPIGRWSRGSQRPSPNQAPECRSAGRV